MTIFYVELSKRFKILAETEDEAIDQAYERANEYRLSECDTISVEEE